MEYQLITSTDALQQYCQSTVNCKYLAIDTEFLRERNYFPKLCLIQIASLEGHAIIDPLAEGLDLEPLRTTLANPNTTKIFHSGEQDLELFYQLFEELPTPIFDTQIASQALGLGDSIAYHNLVKHMLDVSLDKSQQYTHWDKRPLTQEQLKYALGDVTYLLELAPMLIKRLQDRRRETWIEDSLAELVDTNRLVPSATRTASRIKHRLNKPIQLAAIQELGWWREQRAMSKNLPRSFIMKDEVLTEIAKRMPRDEAELGKLRLLKPIKNPHEQQLIIRVLDTVRNADPSTYPVVPKRPDVLPDKELIGLLSIVLKQRCKLEQVSPRLIASRKDLEKIALGQTDLAVMQGWRYDIFGKYAKQLLNGKLQFHWDKEQQQVVMD